MPPRFTSLQPAADLPQLLALLGIRREKEGEKPGGSWYDIRNASEAEAEVFIYDVIGEFGVSASEFVNELRQITAKKIALHINSPGGNVFDGITIFNAIRRHPAEVTVWIDGVAGSAASFIAMSGNQIVMAPHSTMMIHEAHGLCMGPADEMTATAELLNKASDNIASIYAERAGGTVAHWRTLMRAETLFSDVEAVAAGLADRVDGESEEAVAARMQARVQNSDNPPEGDALPGSPLDAVRAGTSAVVRKQPIPDFDFLKGVKEGVAV